MRIRRSTRLGVVLVGVLGLAAGYVPPASANGTGTVDFQGDAVLTGGLDAPCAETVPVTPDTTVTKGTKTCPPQVAPGGVTKKEPALRVNGNTRTGAFASTVCVATFVNGPNKLGNKTPGPKPATEGPNCTISAFFTVTGYCGLSQGRGTGTFQTQTPQVPSGTYRNNYWFNFTWVSMSTVMIIRGNVWKTGPTKPSNPAQLSDLEAVARTSPRPALPGEPSNSCFDKTARRFFIAGAATVTHPKVQP